MTMHPKSTRIRNPDAHDRTGVSRELATRLSNTSSLWHQPHATHDTKVACTTITAVEKRCIASEWFCQIEYVDPVKWDGVTELFSWESSWAPINTNSWGGRTVMTEHSWRDVEVIARSALTSCLPTCILLLGKASDTHVDPGLRYFRLTSGGIAVVNEAYLKAEFGAVRRRKLLNVLANSWINWFDEIESKWYLDVPNGRCRDAFSSWLLHDRLAGAIGCMPKGMEAALQYLMHGVTVQPTKCQRQRISNVLQHLRLMIFWSSVNRYMMYIRLLRDWWMHCSLDTERSTLVDKFRSKRRKRVISNPVSHSYNLRAPKPAGFYCLLSKQQPRSTIQPVPDVYRLVPMF